jgi:hypothetical protein
MAKKKNDPVSTERIAELVALLEIPATVTTYPWIALTGRDNIMFDISSASKAWKYVDVGVSNRIFSIVNSHCQSSDEVDALLNAISADGQDE